jgi:hypothetical protein
LRSRTRIKKEEVIWWERRESEIRNDDEGGENLRYLEEMAIDME